MIARFFKLWAVWLFLFAYILAITLTIALCTTHVFAPVPWLTILKDAGLLWVFGSLFITLSSVLQEMHERKKRNKWQGMGYSKGQERYLDFLEEGMKTIKWEVKK